MPRMWKESSRAPEFSILTVLPQIQRLIAALATGQEVEAEQCCDWTQLHWDAARSHGLSPWLYRQLLECIGTCLPSQVKESLRHDYLRSALASIFRDKALKQVLEAFGDLRLSVVPLKGVYLSHAVYDDPALRTMSDIDLLVEEGNFHRAQNALVSMGFARLVGPIDKCNPDSCPALSYTRTGSHPDAVDLHRQVCFMDHYSLPASTVWSESKETTLHGCRVRFLSPELNFIHIGAHSLNHGPLLRDWLDLVLIVKQTSFQWEKFVILASSLGVLRPMYWVIRELTRHWGVRPPEAVTNALTQYHPRPLEDRVIRGRWRYVWRVYSRVSACKGWREKVRYLRFRVLPPADYREAVVGSTSQLLYLKSKIDFFVHFWRQS